MSVQQRLRQIIDEQQAGLGAAVPPDRQKAILAILRTRDRLARQHDAQPRPNLVTGLPMADPGGNLALRLCLEAIDNGGEAPSSPEDDVDHWAERFLEDCGRLAEAELVLTHVETGFMRLIEDGEQDFAAWIATKRAPAIWQERADIAWWASWLARQDETAPRALDVRDHDEVRYRRQADAAVNRMASYQLGYPPDATIGDVAFQTYRDVLRSLITRALPARVRGELAGSWPEDELAADIAAQLTLDPAIVSRAVDAFTLDRENAAWHAAVPGVAAAPLVRIAPDRLAWSTYGLTAEPFFFLLRELRRCDAQAYHNSAHLREDVFRQDLYALFADKRFVTSPGRIALRKEGGDLRTDTDAAVFDRKTGTLGLFELKSQDPFARTAAELARQQENLRYANRQLSGVLTWLNRYGPDALLSRVDAQTAKRFRVQKVYPFVLGRYLVHGGDGPEQDRRAAWGSWPHMLHLLDGQPFSAAANPLASLHARLTKDDPFIRSPVDAPARQIAIGPARLVVYPSYGAFRDRAAERDSKLSRPSARRGAHGPPAAECGGGIAADCRLHR
jgi:hypothetical protein